MSASYFISGEGIAMFNLVIKRTVVYVSMSQKLFIYL